MTNEISSDHLATAVNIEHTSYIFIKRI